MRIVGITGKAGSGKDLVTGWVRDTLGKEKVVQISLAAPLKNFAQVVFDFTPDQLWGPSEHRNKPDSRFDGDAFSAWSRWAAFRRFKRHYINWLLTVLPPGADWKTARRDLAKWMARTMIGPISPRSVLQTLGTEWGRSVDPDIWLHYALRTAYELQVEGVQLVVISDVRFPNEARFLIERGGEVWRIVRPTSLDPDSVHARHASESEQDSIEMDGEVLLTIYNTGSLHTLRKNLDYILSLRFGQGFGQGSP